MIATEDYLPETYQAYLSLQKILTKYPFSILLNNNIFIEKVQYDGFSKTWME